MYKTGYEWPDWVVPAATQGSIGIGSASNDLYYAVLLKCHESRGVVFSTFPKIHCFLYDECDLK